MFGLVLWARFLKCNSLCRLVIQIELALYDIGAHKRSILSRCRHVNLFLFLSCSSVQWLIYDAGVVHTKRPVEVQINSVVSRRSSVFYVSPVSVQVALHVSEYVPTRPSLSVIQ